jgi:predicted RNA-binding Zn ribbon-like protein
VIPAALVLLANLGRPRKPSRASARTTEPALPDAVAASSQLASVITLPVRETDLPGLRDLQRFACQAAGALLAGELPETGVLNDLACGSSARVRLTASGGSLRPELAWHDVSVAGELARRLIEELTGLDPTRLRRCAREPCGLLFYDSTRSRTQRWHAEDPCGWRERQHSRRARALRTQLLTGQRLTGQRLVGLRWTGPSRDQVSRRSAAHRVSWCRVDSCSLRSTDDTWLSTVLMEMYSSRAISR